MMKNVQVLLLFVLLVQRCCNAVGSNDHNYRNKEKNNREKPTILQKFRRRRNRPTASPTLKPTKKPTYKKNTFDKDDIGDGIINNLLIDRYEPRKWCNQTWIGCIQCGKTVKFLDEYGVPPIYTGCSMFMSLSDNKCIEQCAMVWEQQYFSQGYQCGTCPPASDKTPPN